MKRIAITLLAAIIAFNTFVISSGAENADRADNAFRLLESLEKNAREASDEFMTRAEFIVMAESLLLDGVDSEANECVFSDIDTSDSELAAAVNFAVGQGAIAEGDSFRPDAEVTFDEAFKIMGVLLGYRMSAENAGGYPSGYRALAIRNGLTDGMKNTAGNISCTQALILFENFIKAPLLAEVYSENKISYVNSGETILSSVYSAYEISGIVTGNSETVFGDENREIKDCKIRINGDEFKSIVNYDEYIGCRVSAWVCESDGDLYVLAMRMKNTSSVTLELSECEKRDDASIVYNKNNKTYRTDKSVNVIYNGRFIRENFAAMVEKGLYGTVTLIENDGDSSYDAAIISEPEYMFIKMTDSVDMKIYDTYDNSKLISLGDDDVRYSVFDFGTGEKLKFSDIAQGTVVGVLASADKKLFKFFVNLNEVSGQVTAKSDGGKLEIDGTEYNTSKYFDENYASAIKAGTKADFTLGINGEIAVADVRGGKFVTAYLINAAQEKSLSKKLQIKVFGLDSEIKVFDCSDTLFIDGDKYTDSDKMYKKLLLTADAGQTISQLIRYSTDENGAVKKIDTYADGTEFFDGNKLPVDNQLTRYKFADEYRFRHYGNLCSPYFNSNKATFFLLPFDRSNEEDYQIVTSSYFGDGVYSFIPYNVGLDGCAQYITYETERTKEGLSNITGDTPCLTVEKVINMRDEDENYSPVLCGWSKGKFIEYRLDEKIVIKKDSGSTELGFGDICFYEVSNNKITGLQVVFDAAKDVFAPTGTNYFRNGAWNTTSFAKGKLYSAGSGYMYLSDVKNADGTYDFSFQSLTHITAAQKDVVVIDMKNKEMRPGSLDDLRGYVNAGDDADWIIINYSWLYGYMITVYRGCDA